MTPDEILKGVKDPRASAILYGGLAVIAAAAVAASLKVDFYSAVRSGAVILALGALLGLVAFVFNDATLRLVLGWFITLFIILVSMTFFFSAVTQGRYFIPPVYCLVHCFDRDPCNAPGGAADDYATRNFTPVVTPKTVEAPPSSQFRPADYQVFVQFAGVIQRKDVKDMMIKLKGNGWRVEGASEGGERTTSAIGYNEIRYLSPGDEPAARALAVAVQNANLTPTPVAVKLNSKVTAKSLQVWLFR